MPANKSTNFKNGSPGAWSGPVPSFAGLLPASARASLAKSQCRSRGSRAEIELRKALSAIGLRYRLHVGDLPGRPDVVFPRQRVDVFVDGDFWHGRQWKARARLL